MTRRAAADKYRAETPLLDQLKAALAKKNDDAARDDFEAAAKVGQLDAAVEVLFAKQHDPGLVATSLQFVLNQVTLSKERWKVVASGAAQLGNNAIRDQAEAKAK